MVEPGKIEITAPAKINLSLEILGRRPDSYHKLDSLVGFIGLSDKLSIAPAPSFRLTIDGPFAAHAKADQINLVTKAFIYLSEFLGYRDSVSCHLTKNIPAQAGLGGGSADAAAMLVGLLRTWKIRPPLDQLLALAAKIGSDVPVFVSALLNEPPQKRFALYHLQDRGETVTRLFVPPKCALLIVWPGQGLSTQTVFDTYAKSQQILTPDPLTSSSAVSMPTQTGKKAFLDLVQARQNHLFPAAQVLMPALTTLQQQIIHQKGCLCARMSGSGSALWGLFKKSEQAAAAASHFNNQGFFAWSGGWFESKNAKP